MTRMLSGRIVSNKTYAGVRSRCLSLTVKGMPRLSIMWLVGDQSWLSNQPPPSLLSSQRPRRGKTNPRRKMALKAKSPANVRPKMRPRMISIHTFSHKSRNSVTVNEWVPVLAVLFLLRWVNCCLRLGAGPKECLGAYPSAWTLDREAAERKGATWRKLSSSFPCERIRGYREARASRL
jgi:hypothetical protein